MRRQRLATKAGDKVSPVLYWVVLKEGSLVSSAAMRRGHTPHPPVPAVPPSQTNDCKGFLRFKPSQRRPKSSSSRPKGCGGVLLRVLRVRSAVEGGQFVRTVAAVRREALER